MLDTTDPAQQRFADRLTTDAIVWLGSTRPDGRPHHVPIWFAWRDPLVLLFTQPRSQKVRNVEANPAVTLTLDSAAGGKDVVIVEGRARLIDDVDATADPFAGKYRERMEQTPESWAEQFPQAVLVTITRVFGWSAAGSADVMYSPREGRMTW